MGQRKRSERTTSISIDRFWNQVCPTFPSQNLAIKNEFFELFGAYQEGGRSSFYKRLCTRVSLQNAVRDKIHPETRTSCTESALSRWQELWAWILWTWVKLDYWQKEQESGRIGYVSSIAGNRMQWPKKMWQKHGADFELQSSELWGNKNEPNAQLQIQLIGFEWFWKEICPTFPSESLYVDLFFWVILGSSYHDMIVSYEPKMVWGFNLYVNVTEHDWQKRAIGFPVWPNASQINHYKLHFRFASAKWNAATKCSARPLTTKREWNATRSPKIRSFKHFFDHIWKIKKSWAMYCF